MAIRKYGILWPRYHDAYLLHLTQLQNTSTLDFDPVDVPERLTELELRQQLGVSIEYDNEAGA